MCHGGPGTISFNRSWSDTGRGKVTARVAITLSNCTGAPAGETVTVSGRVTFANGSCSANEPPVPTTDTFKFIYSPALKTSIMKTTGVINSLGAVDATGPITGSYANSSAGFSGDAAPFGNCATGITGSTFIDFALLTIPAPS